MNNDGEDSSSDEEAALREEAQVFAPEYLHTIEETSRTFLGHIGAVTALAGGKITPSLLVSGSTDFTARMWDIETGKCTGLLEGHVAAVRDVVMSPDERVVFTAGDTCVRIWDRVSGQQVGCLQGHQGHVTTLDAQAMVIGGISDGLLVASGSFDCCVKIWDMKAKLPVRTCTGHRMPVVGAKLLGDGKQMISCGMDCVAKIFDIAGVTARTPFTRKDPEGSARHLRAIKCAKAPMCRTSLSKDHVWLSSTSSDSACCLTKIGPDTTTMLMGWDDGSQVWGTAFQEHGRRLAVAGGDDVVVWGMSGLMDWEHFRNNATAVAADDNAPVKKPSIKTLVHALVRLTGAGGSSKRFGDSGSRLWGCHFAGENVLAGAQDGSIALWEVPEQLRADTAGDQRSESRSQRTRSRGRTSATPGGSRGSGHSSSSPLRAPMVVASAQ